ncbi:MAG: Lipoprotein NosD family containing CASH domain [Candidatus Methanohalarchaeum thermophilum]|uniref:Lipoprotein NosD family containing CASH domain n=1 Tax=Methanohalarchaeum thermophilum TaxID=1903181 RepID=A0A1Q6DXZ1_METT1|nr:MAG: Lipoprotein NosD family containing CASH domain [Candidatus Methanohalarchaeum thermophilum]
MNNTVKNLLTIAIATTIILTGITLITTPTKATQTGADIPDYGEMSSSYDKSEIDDMISDGELDEDDFDEEVPNKLVFPDGEYDNFQVAVENITIASATRGGAVIDAGGDDYAIDVEGTDEAKTITIKGFKVTGWTTGGIAHGTDAKDGTVVDVIHNKVKTGGSGPVAHGNSIQVVGDGSVIKYNYVEVTGYDHEEPDWATSGILGMAKNLEITNNKVEFVDAGESSHHVGIAVGQWQSEEINLPAEQALVKDNTIIGSETGISVEGGTDSDVVEHNLIKDTETAVATGTSGDDSGETPTNTEVHFNNLSNNEYGVCNYGDDTVNATLNYWGSNSGPSNSSNTYNVSDQGVKVVGDVDYTPWLVRTDDKDECTSFAPVVNDDTGLKYSSIQEAIDNAEEGNKILIKPGKYQEEVEVEEDITLKGTSSPFGNQPAIVKDGVNIRVDGVTVKNLKITNTGNSGEQEAIFVGDPNGYEDDSSEQILIKNNLIDGVNTTSSDFSVEGIHIKTYGEGHIEGVVIENNIIRDIKQLKYGADGIKLQADLENIEIVDNEISGVEGYWSYGIVSTPSSLQPGVPKDVLIRYNNFSEISSVHENWANVIGIDGGEDLGYASASEVEFNYNNIFDTTAIVVNKDSDSVLDARLNYWGDETGPERTIQGESDKKVGDGAKVVGEVGFKPWLPKPVDEFTNRNYKVSTMKLEKGWNTFSVPFEISSDELFGELIPSYEDPVVSAYKYDSEADKWKEVNKGRDEIEAMQAIYIKVDRPVKVNLDVNAELRSPPAVELDSGWNLVGPSPMEIFSSVQLSDGFGINKIEEVSAVLSGGPNEKSWKYQPGQSTGDEPDVSAFSGYWVYMDGGEEIYGFKESPKLNKLASEAGS